LTTLTFACKITNNSKYFNVSVALHVTDSAVNLTYSTPQAALYQNRTEDRYTDYYICKFSLSLKPSAGYGLLIARGFMITHNDAPQSGQLWMSDQLIAETCA
jgi:hypothetical protein